MKGRWRVTNNEGEIWLACLALKAAAYMKSHLMT
jgi:hypothetical protein